MSNYFLEIGDVVEADRSWRVISLSEDFNTVHVDQNMKNVFSDTGEKTSMEAVLRDLERERIEVPDYEGPLVSDAICEGRKTSEGDTLTLATVFEQSGINLDGMRFVVTEVNKSDDDYKGGPPGWHVELNRYQVTLQALNEDGTANEDGLVVSFYQSGYFDPVVKEVNVVDKMKQVFVPVQK